jgi:hypothetical protein
MRPWQSLTPEPNDESDTCSCLLPCGVMIDDGYDDWKANALSDEQASCASTHSMSTRTSCEASTFSGNFIHSKSSKTNTVKGLYRPRSGLSAKVRFVLPVSSYLTGDFDLLPAVKEKCHSPKSPKSSSASLKSVDASLALPKSSILRMKTSVLPEVPNEMWMNIDHEEQEENHEYNGMILVISPGGVELKDAYNECRNVGESICDDDDDDDDSFDGDENAGTTTPRDIPLDVTIPVVTISEDDISRIYDEPDCYIMRDDERLSAQKVAASHGLLSRVRNLVSELGPPRAYKVFTRHGKERFEI